MNECMVQPLVGCNIFSAGEALALGPAVLASDKAQQQLTKSADSVMRAVFAALENLILVAIEKRSSQEFEATRSQVFASYCNAVLALPILMKVVLPENALNLLVRESLCEAEAELRDPKAVQFFGVALRDQAMFALWTLRKITELVSQIPNEKSLTVTEAEPKLRELLSKFIYNGVWTRFHLQCLFVSLRASKPVAPATLESILMGLRAAVNAYAYVKQAVDILAPRTFVDDPPQEWDDEDARLLSSATIDFIREEI
jgi:hypothetical protein